MFLYNKVYIAVIYLMHEKLTQNTGNLSQHTLSLHTERNLCTHSLAYKLLHHFFLHALNLVVLKFQIKPRVMTFCHIKASI